MEKATLKYTVHTFKHPHQTGVVLQRPVITDRPTMGLKGLVEYAKTAGYVRGQTRDLEGTFTGMLQAAQDRALAGYSINLNDWLIISGKLKGTVDDTRQLTSANEYHVTITAKKELKASADDFIWQRVDEGEVIQVKEITSPNGRKGEITKTKAIVANGKNLAYSAAWGDSVKVEWTDEDGEAHELALTPSESAQTYLRFDWPTGLAEVAPGTLLKFSFRLHGKEGAAEQLSNAEAKLIAAA